MSTQMPSKPAGLRFVPIALAATVLVAALLLSLASRTSPDSPAEPTPHPSAQLAPLAPASHDDATAARLLALERRVMELSARPAPAPAPEPASPAQPAPAREPDMDPLPPDPKAQEELVHVAFEQQVETALRDPVDAAWANTAGRTLHDELQSLRGNDERYRLVRVDCRTRTCLAELDFTTFADARSQLGRLVVETNLEGCSSTGHIDPTEDPASRSKMRLLFDCNRSQSAR
jgi:hypothetical protein